MILRISFLFAFFCGAGQFLSAQNNYKEVTLPELMQKKRQGGENMVIVDVRSPGEYGDSSRGKSGNIGRIKDAINLNVQELQNDPAAVKKLDSYRDREIYLICSHSYRSRAASNILLKNGFTHVNNVRGGMTEWYRRYNEMAAYRDLLQDQDLSYINLSPAQLLGDLQQHKNILLLGIRNKPRFWWDSATVNYYRYFPLLKNTRYFDFADSLKLLEEVQKEPGRPVVLFNMVNNGAGELAEWLKQKGVPRVAYLVGGINLFFEYSSDLQPPVSTDEWFESQSTIRFITPRGFCNMPANKNVQVVDIRHDSLFNKVNEGVKHNFKHLSGAVNYYAGRGADSFEQAFPDKKKQYVFINAFGSDGILLAADLSARGYKISWLNGGYDRWEWFMNNDEQFGCNNSLVQ